MVCLLSRSDPSCFVSPADEPISRQGEEPTNMRKFWRFLLRKSLPRDSLTSLRYAVFGLGDSSYPRFNFPAKKLFKRIQQLGGDPLLPRGDGDDQHYLGYPVCLHSQYAERTLHILFNRLDGALDPWIEELWVAVDKVFPLPAGVSIIPKDVLPPPSFHLNFDPQEFQEDAPPLVNVNYARVLQNNRITSKDHFQDVRHVIFEAPGVSYRPADVMVLYPRNLPGEVQQVIEHFGWNTVADQPFQLKPLRSDASIPNQWNPNRLTVRTALERFLDIFGRPRRSFFELLAFFATDPLHAEKLREFASSEGQDELYNYCHRTRRTYFEVLQDFTSVKLPVAYLFDLIPPIRPRSYSIASCPETNPGQIHLAVAIVKYKTKLQKPRVGVCSHWIESLQVNDSASFIIQRGTMTLPATQVPVIFLGPGTGVAPIRSLIQARIRQGAEENFLFTGFRGRKSDFLFEEDWNAMAASGGLRVFPAFSRDQEEKEYIQHKLLREKTVVWDVIERGGFLYLSGNAKNIPKSIADALVSIVRELGGPSLASEAAAQELVGELEKSRRYQTECWS
ncbi:hypothetical protein DFJ73DRAFT_850762 [Zopfochytrium polystomum]|nr:hypothetical protein DFJ73DRAFT_850762 [Zopfochytrium polystomum]